MNSISGRAFQPEKICDAKVEQATSHSLPSDRVVAPKVRERGQVHFNKKLAPDGAECFVPQCKPYIPDTSQEFYSQINMALSNGVKFVVFIIDAMTFNNNSIIDLIEFCKKQNIPIVDIEFENNSARGWGTHECYKKHYPETAHKIIKPTLSIFSTPETHEYLKEKKPDALIVAGQVADICIKASIFGLKSDSEYHEWFNDEFGAIEYGFPVYTHPDFIYDYYPEKGFSSLQHERFYKFSSISPDHS